MLTGRQRDLREQLLAAPVVPPPAPWRLVSDGCVLVGGLLGIGFAVNPFDGEDLVMVVSQSGHGLFDTTTGARIARNSSPEPAGAYPAGADLSCPGLGPISGSRVLIAGLLGGGLHTTTQDHWTVTVASPEWPDHRVVLSVGGGLYPGPAAGDWWQIFNADFSDLRAAGFSPSGRTLAVATSSDLTLWTRLAPIV